MFITLPACANKVINALATEVRFYEYYRRHNGNHTLCLCRGREEKQLSKTTHDQFTLYCGPEWNRKKKRTTNEHFTAGLLIIRIPLRFTAENREVSEIYFKHLDECLLFFISFFFFKYVFVLYSGPHFSKKYFVPRGHNRCFFFFFFFCFF